MRTTDLVDGEFWFDRNEADGGGIELLNIEGRIKTCHLLTIPPDARAKRYYQDRLLTQMNLTYADGGGIYLASPDVPTDGLKSQLRRLRELPRLERCNGPAELRPEVLEGHSL